MKMEQRYAIKIVLTFPAPNDPDVEKESEQIASYIAKSVMQTKTA